jgi:hypothetical protein
MIEMQRQYPIVIAETKPFQNAAKKLITEDELSQIIGHVAFHPEGGDLIQGAGGIRKLRWDRPGMGKSGGLRVIYFFHDLNMPLYLLAVYPKSQKSNITDSEKAIMGKLTKELIRTYTTRHRSIKLEVIS